jgi:hypothetical protein
MKKLDKKVRKSRSNDGGDNPCFYLAVGRALPTQIMEGKGKV